MDKQEVISLIIKWAVPFLCTGLFAICIKPIFANIAANVKRQRKESWDSQSTELKEEVNKVSATCEKISTKLCGVQEAVLTMHLYNLIRDSQRYIERGYIELDEYDDYMQRYQTYLKLGGNGHMEPWYPRVIQLPIKNPEE